MSLNDILFRYTSSGASAATAAQDDLRAGVDASHQMAMTDLPRLKKYSADFLAVGQKHGLPPALLAAISSRETRGGGQLSKSGYGSNGADFGLMQVNKDSHKLVGGAFSREHIDQAAGILKKFHLAVKKKHPSWPPEQQLRGTVAAYNFGVSNVRTLGGIDEGTANDDYSSDVWERAKALAPHFGGIGGPVGSSSNPPGPKAVSSMPEVSTPVASHQGKAMSSQPAVYELQMILVKYGYMTEAQVQTGPGILGPKTQAAVARFLDEHGRTSPGSKPGPVASGGGTSSSEGPKSVFPTKSVAMIDGVPLYKQGDKAWGKRNLGAKENLSIHAAGCAMTSVAMAISKISGQPINPKELDEYLDSHGGYGGSSGNGLVWDVAAKARGLYAARLHNCSLVSIDKELMAGRPVVAGVDYKKGSGGGGNGTDHWVTITGKYSEGGGIFYSAHDPATGQKFTFKVDGTRLQSINAINKYFTTGEICTFKSAAKAKVA